MNFEKIAHNISKAENGIYYSKAASSISYPEVGNENYMQIEQDSFWFNHRNDVIAKSALKHSAAKVFFDIGGGNGFVAKRLQDEGIETVLIEPGKAGAMNARKRGIENVLCSTIEDAEFEHDTLDSVGLFDVVEHIEDDTSFLKNINKYLKDDGYIYITVPAFNFLWSNEDKDAGHYRRYSTTQLNELLENCGFSIVHSTYIFSILPIPVFFFRSLPSRLGFNKKSNELVKHQKEHQQKKGILNNMLQTIWKWELSRLERYKKIPVGGSCFVIAKKVS
ncbi:MAG: class I SAM-dependent methyltransferase [Marinicellaceae bacterium]